MESTYFRKGFGLKSEVQPLIDAEYHSALVQSIRGSGNTLVIGDVTVRLAEEFGFCYGVDRAIDYAYETRHKFPHRRIHLVGKIIHNPHVNQRIRDMGMEFIQPDDAGAFDFSHLTKEDVVVMPAFGVTMGDFSRLRAIGCVLVDTTLWIGPLGLEAGRELRARRVHRRDSRKALPRGIEGDRLSGPAARGRHVHHRAGHGGGGDPL